MNMAPLKNTARWALALLLGMLAQFVVPGPVRAEPLEAFQHGEPPLAGLGGPIELIDHQGQGFTLQRLGDQAGLMFFGFTRCATACPAALVQAREFLAQFKARKAPKVIFVTLDPLSDDPATLQRYLSGIDTRITGLTGTPAQISRAATRYGVATQGKGVALEHSARWYVVNAQGSVLRVYSSRDHGADMAADLTRLQQQANDTRISLRK